MDTGLKITGGEGGIRTLDTGVSPYNGLANRRLQPLGHLSGVGIDRFLCTRCASWRSEQFHHNSWETEGVCKKLTPKKQVHPEYVMTISSFSKLVRVVFAAIALTRRFRA